MHQVTVIQVSGTAGTDEFLMPIDHPDLITPALDQLALKEGVILENFYTYKYCAPTRGSVLTGRFPFKLTAPEHNFIPWWLPVGTNLSYTMLPAKLKQAKYATHHIGKVSTDIVLTPDSYK